MICCLPSHSRMCSNCWRLQKKEDPRRPRSTRRRRRRIPGAAGGRSVIDHAASTQSVIFNKEIYEHIYVRLEKINIYLWPPPRPPSRPCTPISPQGSGPVGSGSQWQACWRFKGWLANEEFGPIKCICVSLNIWFPWIDTLDLLALWPCSISQNQIHLFVPIGHTWHITCDTLSGMI